jgi:hypothetical protein
MADFKLVAQRHDASRKWYVVLYFQHRTGTLVICGRSRPIFDTDTQAIVSGFTAMQKGVKKLGHNGVDPAGRRVIKEETAPDPKGIH